MRKDVYDKDVYDSERIANFIARRPEFKGVTTEAVIAAAKDKKTVVTVENIYGLCSSLVPGGTQTQTAYQPAPRVNFDAQAQKAWDAGQWRGIGRKLGLGPEFRLIDEIRKAYLDCVGDDAKRVTVSMVETVIEGFKTLAEAKKTQRDEYFQAAAEPKRLGQPVKCGLCENEFQPTHRYALISGAVEELMSGEVKDPVAVRDRNNDGKPYLIGQNIILVPKESHIVTVTVNPDGTETETKALMMEPVYCCPACLDIEKKADPKVRTYRTMSEARVVADGLNGKAAQNRAAKNRQGQRAQFFGTLNSYADRRPGGGGGGGKNRFKKGGGKSAHTQS